jgi:hypothetical protein
VSVTREKEKNKMGICVRVTKASLPKLLERLEKETSVRWGYGGELPTEYTPFSQPTHLVFDGMESGRLTLTTYGDAVSLGYTRAPHHTAFVREVAKVCPPEGVPQVTNFCAGCKDRQDKIDALTTQDAKLEEAETAIVEMNLTIEHLVQKVNDQCKRLAALESTKPTAPRVPSRIGAPCEVWENGESGRQLWYFVRESEGKIYFTDIINPTPADEPATLDWSNFRELAPVEGGEG